MGIMNVTPNSFADGGLNYPDGHPGRAIDAARALVAEGADIIDVGGESTRPGAEPVDAESELSRVLPVIRALVSDGVCVSIDTRKPAVAESALAEGAAIVNDVGGASEPDLLALAAKAGAVYVLMHSRSTPADMAEQTDYDDVVAEVYEFLADGLARCEEAGPGARAGHRGCRHRLCEDGRTEPDVAAGHLAASRAGAPGAGRAPRARVSWRWRGRRTWLIGCRAAWRRRRCRLRPGQPFCASTTSRPRLPL